MRQRNKKPCGIVSIVDCDGPGWSCERCIAADEFILDKLNQERLRMVDDIEKLPTLLRSKEMSIINLKQDIDAKKEFTLKPKEREEK